MAKFESINLLFKLLRESRHPLSKKQMQEQLECSAATVERYLTELRDTYGQKVEYVRDYRGYQLNHDDDDIELPSHLFTSQEINAILLVDQLINDLEPGFLKQDMQSVKQHLDKIKKKFGGADSIDEKRIRMINIGKRQHTKSKENNHLSTISQAVLQRKQILIEYKSRSSSDTYNSQSSERLLSPQRLTHYRDNWYLDAWCHQREALRTFALERIATIEQSNETNDEQSHIVNMMEEQLDAHYAQTFGIFGGKVIDWAILKFTPHRSQWVAEEIWHQNQRGKWLEDGSYQLEIPYGNDLELIGDILKYGDQVELISPEDLRLKLASIAQNIIKMYQN